VLYMCNGEMNSEQGHVQIMRNGEWTAIDGDKVKAVTGRLFEDFVVIEVDSDNDQHFYVGARNGLYEFNNAQLVKYYDCSNSPIEPFDGKTMEYQMITGVCFDNEGTLWMLNSQAPNKSLLKMDASGMWNALDMAELMKFDDGGTKNKSLAYLRSMTKDRGGNMWFANDDYRLPSFYLFSPISETLIPFTNFVNQDGTSVSVGGVKCVAEDREGNVWVGTTAGPLYVASADVTTANATLNQPKIPRNDGTNYADYMLSGVEINDIAIDAANRKWMATNGSGAFLISSDNQEEVQHFTTENSALLSDNVQAIEINDATGEVFFGTDKGLCSYMSDATASAEEGTSVVYAYPNPVRPDYTGEIRVVGLSYNADVKIVSVDGSLVYSGRSNGGSFTWDGYDMNGRRVASGVYNVLTAREDGSKGTACKIAIVR